MSVFVPDDVLTFGSSRVCKRCAVIRTVIFSSHRVQCNVIHIHPYSYFKIKMEDFSSSFFWYHSSLSLCLNISFHFGATFLAHSIPEAVLLETRRSPSCSHSTSCFGAVFLLIASLTSLCLLFLSWPCLNHLLKQILVHFIQVFFGDVHERCPLFVLDGDLTQLGVRAWHIHPSCNRSNVTALERQRAVIPNQNV